jgi:hypothetical protein
MDSKTLFSILVTAVIFFILGYIARQGEWFDNNENIKLELSIPEKSPSNSRPVEEAELKNINDTLICSDKQTKGIFFDLPSILADLFLHKQLNPSAFEWDDVGFYANFASYPTDRGNWGDKAGKNTIKIQYVHKITESNPSIISGIKIRNVGDMCPDRCAR